ncbi:unnamed protein product [Nesidiocoris tenuis]|uniref:DNA/RNA-binding protein Alba-like domain-containing protein n=1 Tax=Nesidiocoris tenuis TaxID=355587 RepID=A0A6H5G3D2_9HEMI|nr:unnamed protein product [Nesidiocoris tenuis]
MPIKRPRRIKMENYSKGKNVEEPMSILSIPIPNLPQDAIWMRVRGGSQMWKLLDPAMKAYKEKRPVVWTGEGPALGKAISCAEIMKRKFSNVHQFNHICYRRDGPIGCEPGRSGYTHPALARTHQPRSARVYKKVHESFTVDGKMKISLQTERVVMR